MQKIKPANNATNLTAKPQNLNGNDNDNVNDNVNANENVKGDVYKKGGVGKKEVAGNGDRPTKIVCRKRKMQCRRTRMHEHLFLRNVGLSILCHKKVWKFSDFFQLFGFLGWDLGVLKNRFSGFMQSIFRIYARLRSSSGRHASESVSANARLFPDRSELCSGYDSNGRDISSSAFAGLRNCKIARSYQEN